LVELWHLTSFSWAGLDDLILFVSDDDNQAWMVVLNEHSNAGKVFFRRKPSLGQEHILQVDTENRPALQGCDLV
jgi:hypothetical protein